MTSPLLHARRPRILTRRVLPTFSLVALSVPLGLATAPSAQALTQAPTGPTGVVALTWAPTYMSDDHDYTLAEATALAKRVNLVAAMPVAFKKLKGSMQTANPGLQFIAYANSTLAGAGQVQGLPEAAFAHSSTGARIKTPSFGTYLMESSNWDWRNRTVSICTQRASSAGYQGCLYDMLGLGIFSKNYVTALPVKPGAGRTYTEMEYRDQMINLAAHLRSKLPSYIVVGNGMGNYWRYWRDPVSTRPIALSQPAAQAEDFMRGSADSPTKFPDETQWQGYVDMIRDMETNGSVGLYSTKVWSAASDAQVAQWNKFSMATFLMGANGKSYYAFVRSRNQAGASGQNAPFQMPKNIGVATGAMVKRADGVATRTFTNGTAVVNPTSTSRWVKLSAPMKRLNGAIVTGFQVEPHAGEVLVGAGTVARAGATPGDGSAAAPAAPLAPAPAGPGAPSAGTTDPVAPTSQNTEALVAERRRVVGRLDAESKVVAGGFVSASIGSGQSF